MSSRGKGSRALLAAAASGRLAASDYARLADGPKRSKYGSTRVERDGQRFDSILEADLYSDLRAERALFLRQVPFLLPGGVVWRADFLRILDPAAVVVLDAKGVETPTFKLKRKQVESIYAPLRVETVTRAQLRRR